MSGGKLEDNARAPHGSTASRRSVPCIGQENREAARVLDRVLQISTESSPPPALHVIRSGVEERRLV